MSLCCASSASSRHCVKRAISQIIADVGYQGTDRLHRFIEFSGGPANFPHPMPHFSRRVNVDTRWVGGTPQSAVIAHDCHRRKAVRTNQANICFSGNKPIRTTRSMAKAGDKVSFSGCDEAPLRRLNSINGAPNCTQSRAICGGDTGYKITRTSRLPKAASPYAACPPDCGVRQWRDALLTERPAMLAPELYRAKAAEYAELAKTANSPDDAREFQRHERSFTVLADNEQWLADHHDQTVHAIDAGIANDIAAVSIGEATTAAKQ